MNNPIIQRELIGTLRTGKAVALQIGLIIVLSALVLLRWPGDAQVQWQNIEALNVLRIFGYGLMVIVMLLAPAFPSTSIVKEVQQGTLALLINSPMSRWWILAGKVVGSMGFVVLLLLLSLPTAAACYAMGGINFTDHLLKLYLVLLLVSIEYTALGLWVSSVAASLDSAMRLTYGLVLVLAVVSQGPYLMEVGSVGPLVQEVFDWIRNLSPIPVIMETLGQGGIGTGGTRSKIWLFGRFSVTSLLISALCLWQVGRRLDLTMFDRARSAGRVTDERSTGVRLFRRVMYMWFFDPKRRAGLISPLTNAVLIKEFRTRRFGRGHWMLRLIGLCLIVSLLLTFAASTAISDQQGEVAMIGGILVVLQMALLILMTPSLASGLISGERESGSWQLLQMTPLSARSIIFGKLVSVLWTLLLLLLATLPGYAVLYFINADLLDQILDVLITMLLTAAVALLVSTTVSSFVKRTAQSTTVTYTLLVGLIAGTTLVWLGRDSVFSRDAVAQVLTVNPMATALALIRTPGFEVYRHELVPANWWIMGSVCVVCLLLLLVRTWRLTKPQ